MGNREAMQPRKVYRAEADTVLKVAGSKNQPQARGWGDSVGVIERGECTKVVPAYLGGLAGSTKVVRGIEIL